MIEQEERNRRIFEGREEECSAIWDHIKFSVALWVHRDKEFNSPLFSDIVRDCNFVIFAFTF